MSANVRLDNIGQLLNAYAPMTSVPLLIVTWVNRVQLLKADSLIVFMLPGIETVSKPSHSVNAPVPILVILEGRSRDVIESQDLNALFPMVNIVLDHCTCFKLEHYANALFPIVVNPSGNAIAVKLVQPLKAEGLIATIPKGRLISVNFEQP